MLPAVLVTQEWLATRRFTSAAAGLPRMELRYPKRWAWCSILVALLALFLLGVFPDQLFPFVWLSPALLLAGMRALANRRHVLSGLADGDARAPATYAGAALVAGFFWEMWNSASLSLWQYDLPYVNRFHVFQMPGLGYAGYIPFGLFCADVIRLVIGDQERSNPATINSNPSVS